MSIATLNKRIDDIEFVVTRPDDPENIRFFAVFVGLYESGCGHLETYMDLDPDPRSKWFSAMCYGPEHLDDLTEQGYRVVLVFDPERCSHEALWTAGYYTTEEGTPERAAEERAHAAVFPELKAENLYRWVDVKPGQFLAEVLKMQGAKS